MRNKQVVILAVLVLVVVLLTIGIVAAGPVLMDVMRSSMHVRPPH